MSNTDSTLDTAKQRATDMAENARDTATAKAREEAEKMRSEAVDEVEDAASATRAAEKEFDDDSFQAAALRQIGNQISNVADQLRDKPVDVMLDDVAVFARRNPMLFLGGAALVGFAAARFLKSGGGAPARTYEPDQDPWAGHLETGPASTMTPSQRPDAGSATTTTPSQRPDTGLYTGGHRT